MDYKKGLEYARYMAQIVADGPLAIRTLFTVNAEVKLQENEG